MNTWARAGLTFLFALLCGISAAADDTAAASQILIRNVSVWDGTSDQSTPDQSVLIEGKPTPIWRCRYPRPNSARKTRLTWPPCP